MDNSEMTNNNVPEEQTLPQVPALEKRSLASKPLTKETLKQFFALTGGSIFYCLSAVFVAYGIVKIIGPILSGSYTLTDALPCLSTLNIYELALLGVLILVVFRKVVDDAISLMVLIALFLVGTSMATGTVADANITASFYVGLAGIALALSKILVMRRFARIPFGLLVVLGIGILITGNYLGPVLLSQSLSINPSQELARRGVWLYVYLIMVIGSGIIIFKAMKDNPLQGTQNNSSIPFLQTPVMIYIFALILIIASGIHQYSMAFTFSLERVIGDYVLLAAFAVFLLIEIMRHLGKRFDLTEIAVSCVPLAVMLYAIQQKSIVSTSKFGIGLMCYPPMTLGFCGLAIAGLAIYHKWYKLLSAVFLYGVGIILTIGFSPEQPHALNFQTSYIVIVCALLLYSIIKCNQYVYVLTVVAVGFGLNFWDSFLEFAESQHLTQSGCIAGVFGIGIVIFYLIFGTRLHKNFRIIGTICLAGFVFDYLPDYIHIRYLFVLIGTGLLITGFWFRVKDVAGILILCLPSLVRLYMLAKRIANWRFVIIGFLMLGMGAVISLLKRPQKE